MQYFSVRNWDKYQHYKDRSPPWIKLHNSLLDDPDFDELNDSERYHLLAIWMLASRTNNRMKYDKKWLSRKISATSQINIEKLLKLRFIQLIQEDANCYQDASMMLDLEEERRDREETEERITTYVHFDDFWSIYPKKVDKKKAQEKWDRLKPDDDLFAAINLHLSTAYSDTPKNFIPNPTTYLNGEKWNDEIIPRGNNHDQQRHEKNDYVGNAIRNIESKRILRESD